MHIITKTTISLLASIIIQIPNALASLPKNIMDQFSSSSIVPSSITIKSPNIAENGAVVNISIDSIKVNNNAHVSELWLFDQLRKTPIAHYTLNKNTIAEGLKSRYKLMGTTVIYAVARLSDGSMISGQKAIKITIGGCGGTSGDLDNAKTRAANQS